MVYWILGRLHAKNQGPKSRDKIDIRLFWKYIVAYRCALCNQNRSPLDIRIRIQFHEGFGSIVHFFTV